MEKFLKKIRVSINWCTKLVAFEAIIQGMLFIHELINYETSPSLMEVVQCNWKRLYCLTITQWFCRISSSHLSYACRLLTALELHSNAPIWTKLLFTTSLVQRTPHQLVTSHQVLRDVIWGVLLRFPWELVVLPWRMQCFLM